MRSTASSNFMKLMSRVNLIGATSEAKLFHIASLL